MFYQQIHASLRIPILMIIVLISFVISSCSKAPDVRLTMCQDLTALFLNAPEDIEWQENKPVFRGYNDLEMKVSYLDKSSNKVAKASCFYAYMDNEDAMGAEEFNTPTVAYSTNPNKMLINGRTVKKMVLADGVNAVMLKQGGKAFTKVKEKINEGLNAIYQEINN